MRSNDKLSSFEEGVLEQDRSTDADNAMSQLDMMAFGSPYAPVVFLLIPTFSILPGVYAKYFGIELMTIAAIMFYARMFDAVTDAVIGYFSDLHVKRGGRRKTWVICGCMALMVTAYFLYTPPPKVSTQYYLFWLVSFYLFWTIVDIPHGAWGAEIATSYNNRAKLFSYRVAFSQVGTIGFFALPFLPLFSSDEYTPEVLRIAIYIGILVMVPILIFVFFKGPNGNAILVKGAARNTFKTTAISIIKNKPLRLFMMTYIAASISFGMWTGLVFLYLDGYLGLGDKIAIILLVGNIAGLLSIPVWLRLIEKTSKSVTWAVGMLIYILLLIGCFGGGPGSVWWLSLFFVGGVYVCFACLSVVAPSILGDIVDYGILTFHDNRGGTYFAFSSLIFKVTMGLGTAFGIGVAGYFGFDATTHVQSDGGVFGMRLAFIILPGLCALGALMLTILTPITKHRHSIIRRRIESRLK